MKYLKIVLSIFVLILFLNIATAATWVNDPNNCPTSFQSQNCLGGEVLCGYSGGTVYCYDPALLNPKNSNTTTTFNIDDGSFDGGYLIDCEDYNSPTPYCDNGGSFWCDRNSGCYTTNKRQTICLENQWGVTACGSCRSNYLDCDSDGGECEIQTGSACSGNTGTYSGSCYGSVGDCTSSTNSDCNNDDGDGDLTTCNGVTDGCEVDGGGNCGSGTGTYANNQCLGSVGNCTSAGTNLDCNDDDSDANELTCNSGDGCEIEDGGTCNVGVLSGTYSGCSDSTGNCVVTKSYFETGTEAAYSTSDALLWGTQYGGGALMNFTNANTNESFLVNGSGCIIFPDNTSQCSGTLSTNFTNVAYYNQSNTFSENQTFGANITVVDTGFFGWLGSLVNRITKLFVVDIDASGNINASNYTLNGTTINDWIEIDTDTQKTTFINDSYLYNDSSIIYFNETQLNLTINSLDNNTLYFAKGLYIYKNTTNFFILNETKLNETIEALDNDTLYSVDNIYIYNNGTNVFFLNETQLNSTIDNRISTLDVDTFWNVTGSNYLVNSSGILEVNETKLNETINNLILINSTKGVYIYDVNKTVIFNETKLNETINLVGNYSAGDGITISSKEINATLGTTIDNSEIDADAINTSQIIDGTIVDADINDSTNLTLGQKIVFALGGFIQNIVSGQVNVNGTLNITGGLNVDSGTLFVNETNNNVGIGTTSPTEKLTLQNGTFLQTPGDPVRISTLSDSNFNGARAVHVEGRIAYVLTNPGNKLLAVDIHEPNNPVLLGNVSAGNTPIDLFVSGRHAYTTDTVGDTLRIYDISDPTSLSLVGTSGGIDGASGVYVSGKYAYVAGGNEDFRVVDISDSENPATVGSIDDNSLNDARHVFVSGDYAYVTVTIKNEMQIINVSDPTNPAIVSTVVSLSRPESAYISGRYAYVTRTTSDSIRILDISDPTSPSTVDTLENVCGDPVDIHVSGDYIYVACKSGDGIAVVDISDISNPVIVGTLNDSTNFEDAQGIYVSGRYAYLASVTSDSFSVIDISGIEANAATIGDLAVGSINVWDNLVVEGDAYVRNGLHVGTNGILTQGDLDVGGIISGNGSGLNGIGAGSISAGSINTTHIVNETILTEDIADNNITAAKIAPDSINGTELADTLTLDANMNINGGYNFSVNNSDLFVDVSTGRVGIGTTSLSEMLEIGDGGKIKLNDVTGARTTTLEHMSGNNFKIDTSYGGIELFTAGTRKWFVGESAPSRFENTGLGIYSGNGSGPVTDGELYVEGNVGIGASSPNQKLEVNGSVNISGVYYGNGSGLTDLGWSQLTGVPFGFADDTDNNTLYYAGGIYIYKNGSDYFILNETKLNETINSLNTIWNITGSNYLVNSSGVLEVNETALNDSYVHDIDEPNLNVNSSTYSNSSTWWAGVSGWVSGWFEQNGNNLDFNETKLNETIDSRGVDVGFNSTYNATYDAKADYEFGSNNFNGSGNFTTSGNTIIGGQLDVNSNTFMSNDVTLDKTINSSATNLDLYLPMSDTGSVQYDRSSNGYDGTVTGTGVVCNSTIGNFDGGCSFDGSGGRLSLSDMGNLTSDFTVSTWVKVDTSVDNPSIVWLDSVGSHYLELWAGTSGGFGGYNWKMYIGATTLIDTNVTVVNNTWTHIALVREGSTNTYYVDGIARVNATDSTSYTISSPTIGARVGGVNPIKGSVDEARLYTRALSTDEVMAQASRGEGPLAVLGSSFLDGDLIVTGDATLVNNVSVGDNLNVTGVIYGNGSGLTDINSTWWSGLTGFVTGWFSNVGNELSFNESKLNETIDARSDFDTQKNASGYLYNDSTTVYLNGSLLNETIALEGVAVGFNSTYNATYDAKADYEFGANDFNGSGNFTTSGNAIIGGQLDVNSNTFMSNDVTLDKIINSSTTNLDLYLPMSDAGSIQYDRTSNGYDGNLFGDTVCNSTYGKFGSGCYFDGSGDGVQLPNMGELSEDFSVFLWAKVDTSVDNGALFHLRVSGGYFEIWAGTSGGGGYDWKAYYDGTILWNSGVTVVNNTWTHIGLVRENGIITYYVNGVNVSTVADTTSYSLTSPTIGVRIGQSDNPFKGSIDEVRLYKKALSADEVIAQASRGEGPLAVLGSSFLDGDLIVTGDATLANNVSVGGDLNVTSGVYYGNGSGLTDLTINQSELNVNSSIWWGGITGWVSGWFVNTGNELAFNETKLNETIASEGVRVGFNSTYNATYDAKSDYQFGTNNFNGSGNFTTSGNVNISGVYYGDGSQLSGITTAWNESGVNVYLANGNNNVGIGTASPEGKLQVSLENDGPLGNETNKSKYTLVLETDGDAGSAGLGGGIAFSEDGGNIVSSINTIDEGSSGATGLGFRTGTVSSTSEAMRITNEGNVGIGTDSPNQRLHVLANGSSGYAGADRGILITDATGPRIIFEDSGETTDDKIMTIRYEEQDLTFGSLDDAGSPWNVENILVLNRDGNVGIGTASPAEALHVVGNAIIGASESTIVDNESLLVENTGITKIIIRDSTASEYTQLQQAGSDGAFIISRLGTGGNDISIQPDGDVIFADGSGGFVGIGTATPEALLDLDGGALRLGNITTNEGGEINWENSTGDVYAVTDIFTNRWRLFRQSTGTELFVVNIDTGYVGIGTTTPEVLTDVEGRFLADYVVEEYEDLGFAASQSALSAWVAMISDTITYGTVESDTRIYINGALQVTAASPSTGTFSVSAGDIITTNNKPIGLVAVGSHQGIAPFSLAGTQHGFYSGSSDTIYVYAPYAAATVEYYDDGYKDSDSPTSTTTVQQQEVVTISSLGGHVRLYSTSPVVITKTNSGSDNEIISPASREVLISAQGSQPVDRSSAMDSSSSYTNNGGYYYSEEGLLYATAEADGNGGDADYALPWKAAGDVYIIPHTMAGYVIMSIEPTTVNVWRWNSSSAWELNATHDLTNASRLNPVEINVGSHDSGGSSAVSTAPVLITGERPFYFRTNDGSNDEYPALGYRTKKRTSIEDISSAIWAQSGNNISYTSGNVGIGTDSPTQTLTVVSDVEDEGRVRVEETAAIGWNHPGFELYSEGVFKGGLFYKEQTDNVELYTASATLPVLVIDSSNNVGIGTTAPIKKLHVLGDFYAHKDVNVPARNFVTNNSWVSRTASASNAWRGIEWSSELGIFAAVATGGTNRVMTSPDGITWTGRTSADESHSWIEIEWSSELGIFAAVANDGEIGGLMTSPDGIAWTDRTAAANEWKDITWSPELSLFVVVASSGINQVITSSDGITWTGRTSANESNDWRGVAWSPELGLFAAVADVGTDRVMTSPDGITWTTRTPSADNAWTDIVWSPELGLFAATANTGTDRVMTSTDGITWTGRTSADDSLDWSNIEWSPELGIFAATSNPGDGGLMISSNGINWTFKTPASTDNWRGIAWSPELGIFAVVANVGTEGRVMTSASYKNAPLSWGGNVGIGTSSPAVTLHVQQTGEGNTLRIQDSDGTCNLDPDSGSLVISCSSDEKLKEDIKNTSSALEEFEDIEIKDYVVKASGKNTTGVIAQEINKTNPEMVHIEDGELFVEQPNPWKLLKAIQELQEMFKSLVGGNYSVKSEVVFDEDSVGNAKILVNSTSVRVEFVEEYDVVPIVTLTPLEFIDGAYKVSNKTTKGFSIVLQKVQEIDIGFDWHAFAQEKENVVNVTNITEINITGNLTDGNFTINDTIEMNVTLPDEVNEINITLPEDETLNFTIPINNTVPVNITLPKNNNSEKVIVNETKEKEKPEKNSTKNDENKKDNNSSQKEKDKIIVENNNEELVEETETYSSSITGGVIGTGNQNSILTKLMKFIGDLFN